MSQRAHPRIRGKRVPIWHKLWNILIAAGTFLAISALFAAILLSKENNVGHAVAAGPPTEQQVPTTIPTSGVGLDHSYLILMPPGINKPALSREQAIAIGRTYDNAHPFPARAVLALATLPDTVPAPGAEAGEYNPISGTAYSYRTVQDMLVWVVTFTSPTAINVASSGGCCNHQPQTLLVTHDNMLINAQTGEYEYGFFTP